MSDKKFPVRQGQDKPLPITDYVPEYATITRNLRLMNLSDREIAKVIGVEVDTYRGWIARFPDLHKAYMEGGLTADSMVIGKAFELCMGGTITREVKEVKDWESGETDELVTLKEHGPNAQMIKWWLESRSLLIEREIKELSPEEDEGSSGSLSRDDLKDMLREVRQSIKNRIE